MYCYGICFVVVVVVVAIIVVVAVVGIVDVDSACFSDPFIPTSSCPGADIEPDPRRFH